MCRMIAFNLFVPGIRALYWGDKRSLAMMVCDVWSEVTLTAENLYVELSLISPGWLSAMLSHR